MYAAFGDIHGDLESLELVLNHISTKPDISLVFFTGDFFGLMPHQECKHIFAERERQYLEIRHLIDDFVESTGKTFLAIPGNYDHFAGHFDLFELNHSSMTIDGRKIYGHGGSFYVPSEIAARMEARGTRFDWADYTGQDREEELQRLCQEAPDIILSHSPVRNYVNYFLANSRGRTLLYLGGHTHVRQYFRMVENDNAAYIIRPGAAGKTLKASSDELLPQTFMAFDPGSPQDLLLYTLKDGKFQAEKISAAHKELKDYNDWEKRWEK